MDVRKAAATAGSWRRALASAAAGGAVSAALVVPAFAVEWYPRLVTTVAVLGAVVGAGRLAAAAVPALLWPPRTPPPVPDPPTASVVVTAYDEADVLPATVEACLGLEYPPDALEVVICHEAASTDGTAAVAERAAERHPRVRAVERDRPPGGKAAAANYALAHADGDVVAVLDADQVLEPDALRRAVAWFRADEDVWCVKGRRYGSNPRASLVALHATVEHHLAERVEFVARDALGGFALFTGGQAFFRASVLDELGPFDEEVLLEDVEMACRIHAGGGELRVDPGIVTTEVNPATARAWWRQRVRWARGGMQVGRRHLPSLLAAPDLPLRVKADAAATFGGLFAVPLLVLASPVGLLAVLGVETAPLLPGWWPLALAAALVGVPLVVATAVFLLDARAGRTHARRDAPDGRGLARRDAPDGCGDAPDRRAHALREYVAPLTLWAYALVQAAAVTAAFLEEFVLSRPTVYVTS